MSIFLNFWTHRHKDTEMGAELDNLRLLRTKYEVEFSGDGRILSTKFDIDINAGMSVDMSQVFRKFKLFSIPVNIKFL